MYRPFSVTDPCPLEELQPLLRRLREGRAVQTPERFERGTLLPDGRLDLCKQALGPEHCGRVTDALGEGALVDSLLLGADFVGDPGAASTAGLVERRPEMHTVFLGCNLITAQGAARWVETLTGPTELRGLWLKRNPLGNDGVEAIAKALAEGSALRTLDLVQVELGPRGLQALVQAVATPGGALERLYLGGNPAAGRRALPGLLEAPGLRALSLSASPLGDAGAVALARALADNSTLEELMLDSCGVGDEGAMQIAEAVARHPTLRRLGLGRAPSAQIVGAPANQIGPEGARALAHALLEAPALEALDLGGNPLGGAGAQALLDAAQRRARPLDLRLGRRVPAGLRRRRRELLDALGPVPIEVPEDVQRVQSVYRTRRVRGAPAGPRVPPPVASPSSSVAPPAAALPGPEEIARAVSVLESLAARPEVFFEAKRELAGVRAAANRVVAGIVAESRRRRPPPKRVANPEGRARAKGRRCYMCRAGSVVEGTLLCAPCAKKNVAERVRSADLSGRVALLTGGRVKIGFEAGKKLLRAGAEVIVTTRFPFDAARRYLAELDAGQWQDRLQIIGLDLRDLRAVERLGRRLGSARRLDVLVHNAAQTIWRPPAYYVPWIEAERAARAELPEGARAQIREATAAFGGAAPRLLAPPEPAPGDPGPPAPVDGSLAPTGLDALDLEPEDLRADNCWSAPLGEVSTQALCEAHVINALAPFVLTSELLPALRRSPSPDRHIVLVSAMEGSFSRSYKAAGHPHTNMAKAALNMLTRTSAEQLASEGIYLNCVDTGWITNEQPHPVRERMRVEHGFVAPLDVVDGAARVLNPVFRAAAGELPRHGCFFKDYAPTDW